jgi:hypothetical protein
MRQGRPPKISCDEMRSALNEGLNIWQCAARFECHDATVTNTLRRCGINGAPGGFYSTGKERGAPSEGAPRKISDEEMLAAIDEGLNIWQCAERFGCHDRTITNALRHCGIESAPEGFYSTGKEKKRVVYTKELREAMSQRVSGENNPFYGKKHSAETREKMSRNSAHLTGDRNPFRRSLLRNPEKREEHKRRCKKLWEDRDDEWMREFRETLSKAMAESDAQFGVPSGYESGHMETDKAGRVFYRSSWEKKVCEILDSDECDSVVSFRLEPFCVPYVDAEGISRYTRIDFYLETSSGEKAILEVKPRSLLEVNNNPDKIRGLMDYCRENSLQFSLVHKDMIPALGELVESIDRGELYVAPRFDG